MTAEIKSLFEKVREALNLGQKTPSTCFLSPDSNDIYLPAKIFDFALAALDRLAQREIGLKKAVNQQAEDEGLWFLNPTIGEAYVQQALRMLHRIVENVE